MPIRLDQDAKDRIVRFYRMGHSYAETARLAGVGVSSVEKYLKILGEKIRFGPWDRERIDQAVSLYAQGKSIWDCARALHTNCETVRKYLVLEGVRIRPHIEATKRGSENAAWKGGRHIGRSGYIYLRRPDHPFANSNGYVFEHRLVMEDILGRYLEPGEVVHHKDGNPENNSSDNLQFFATNAEHLKHELTGRIPKWTEEGKARMSEGVRKSHVTMRNLRLQRKNDVRQLDLFDFQTQE